jgi:polar amino acid transport system substrate-binding protein
MADPFEGLVFLTENYAPYNYNKDGKAQGIVVDVLLEMFRQTGSTKGLKDIKVLPWARGYKLAQEKKGTVLFSTARTESRKNMFKWVGPILVSEHSVIAKKDRKIRIQSEKDFDKFKIGAVREDAGELMLHARGVDKKSIYRTNSSKSTARMLAAGRIDLWAYGARVALLNLEKLGHDPNDYEVVFVLKESPLYFAVQKDTDDQLVGRLQAALDQALAARK